MKAKHTSHLGMVVGAVGLTTVSALVIIGYVVRGVVPTIDECLALLLMGIAPSVPFSPVFVSTWLDKMIELRHGKE